MAQLTTYKLEFALQVVTGLSCCCLASDYDRRSSIRCLPRGKEGALNSLHESLWSLIGFDGALLDLVDLLKLFLDPGVPQVEGDLLLLAALVELTRGHCEDKVRILLIVDDL